MDWAALYTSLAVFGVVLAGLSRSGGLFKLAFLLLASCMVSNLVYGMFSPPELLTVNAASDVVFFVIALGAIHCHHEIRHLRPIYSLIYTAMFGGHFFFAAQENVNWIYYTVQNVLFLALILICGGKSVHEITKLYGHVLHRPDFRLGRHHHGD